LGKVSEVCVYICKDGAGRKARISSDSIGIDLKSWFLGGNGNVAKIEAAMNISHSLGQKKDNKEQVTNFIWILIN